eukprot:4376051-Amphidinium_carterae.1
MRRVSDNSLHCRAHVSSSGRKWAVDTGQVLRGLAVAVRACCPALAASFHVSKAVKTTSAPPSHETVADYPDVGQNSQDASNDESTHTGCYLYMRLGAEARSKADLYGKLIVLWQQGHLTIARDVWKRDFVLRNLRLLEVQSFVRQHWDSNDCGQVTGARV